MSDAFHVNFRKLLNAEWSNADITLFSGWHIGYLILVFGLTFLGAFLIRRKSAEGKENKVLNVLSVIPLIIYILNFFMMPLYRSNGQIDLDKLPFHICTIIGIVVVFSQRSKCDWFKEASAGLALTSAMMYMCYPGSALGGVSPFSYKVVETFLFHGFLFAYGFIAIASRQVKLKWKNIWIPLVGLVLIAIWATVGNHLYSSPEHHYDWFFMTGSTFPFIPKWLMPACSIGAVFGTLTLVYLIYWICVKIQEKRNKKIDVVEIIKKDLD